MFYDRLVQACNEQGIALSAVLHKIGLSQGHISNWRSGSLPTYKLLEQLSKELDVSVDYLMELDDIKKRSIPEGMEPIYKAMQESKAIRDYIEEFQKLSPEGKRRMIDLLALVKQAEGHKE